MFAFRHEKDSVRPGVALVAAGLADKLLQTQLHGDEMTPSVLMGKDRNAQVEGGYDLRP